MLTVTCTFRRTVLEDGTEGTAKWKVPKNSKILYKVDPSTQKSVLYFNTTGKLSIIRGSIFVKCTTISAAYYLYEWPGILGLQLRAHTWRFTG